ncbi:MAG TPA: peptidoglycan-binding domain-containing protein [Solirubrobacteraceae bacterium]|nr:peptidoglycan-binding domain-containing protein [Solirubrobacteraceae bacterium]
MGVGSDRRAGDEPAPATQPDGDTNGLATDADGAGAAPDAGANGVRGGEEIAPLEDEGSGKRRRLLAAGAILVAAAVLAAILISSLGGSSHKPAAAGVGAGETTATVTRRTLTESATVEGTLGYGASLELFDRLGGTYTWLPAVGAIIERGGTLYRIDDRPVVLMYGSVPAYRTLHEGVSSGPDVVELNDNLIALGYDPYGAITDVETYGAATADAVRRWQHAEGLSETGKVELGRVVFAPSARRVTQVHVQLGQDPGPGGSAAAGEGEGKSKTTGEETEEEAKAKKKAEEEEKSKDAGKPSDKQKPSSKKPTGDGGKANSDNGDSNSGSPSDEKKPSGESGSGEDEGGQGGGEAVLTTTSTRQLVQVKVKAEQQGLAHVGHTAPVTLPGGEVVRGRVVSVGTVASSSSASESEKGGGESEPATVDVTLELEHPVAHLDEAPVSVEFVSAIRRNVLTVPAAALTATAGGGYAITMLEDGRRRALAVTPGMFADGYVQIEGPGVHEGLVVIEPE